MENTLLKEKIYEVEFEQLEKKEIIKLNNYDTVLNSKLELSVVIGGCTKTIKDILKFKVGDIIRLDKLSDDDMDININGSEIARGESVLLDNKIGIKLSSFK